MDTSRIQSSLRSHGLFNLLICLLLPAYFNFIYIGWCCILSVFFMIVPIGDYIGNAFGIFLAYFPFALLPVSCICGIIRGVKHYQIGKPAKLCILLSALGLLAFAAILLFLYFLTVVR